MRAPDLLRLALGVTIAVSGVSAVAAQEPAPGFEVASIKRVVGEEPAGGAGGPTHFYRRPFRSGISSCSRSIFRTSA